MRNHFLRFILILLTAVLLAGVGDFFLAEGVYQVFAEEVQAATESPAIELQPQPEIGEKVEVPAEQPRDGVSERAVPSPRTVLNGQACTTDIDCQSGACYPFPPWGNNLCEDTALNCAFPNSGGKRYGDRLTMNWSVYTCANPGDGRATWLPRGKANGMACTSDGECQSQSCYPHPPDNRSYCNARELNCAVPNGAGARYGERRTVGSSVYECRDPKNGQRATWIAVAVAGTKPNGVECTSGPDCQSGACYSYPLGRHYCMAQAMNCAVPGGDGARYGDQRTVSTGVFMCQNPGNGPATWILVGGVPGKNNGAMCISDAECGSKSCYFYSDGKKYCVDGSLNCAVPAAHGAQYGDTRDINGSTYQCVNPGGGLRAMWVWRSGGGTTPPPPQPTPPRSVSGGGLCQIGGIDCQIALKCRTYPPDGRAYCVGELYSCPSPGTIGLFSGDPTTVTGCDGLTYECRGAAGWARNGSPVDSSPFICPATSPQISLPAKPTSTSSGQFTTPQNGAQVQGIVPLEVKAMAPAGIANVQMAIDGNTSFCKIENNAPYTCNWDSRKVPNGSHVLTAVIRDKANTTTSVPPVTVKVQN